MRLFLLCVRACGIETNAIVCKLFLSLSLRGVWVHENKVIKYNPASQNIQRLFYL